MYLLTNGIQDDIGVTIQFLSSMFILFYFIFCIPRAVNILLLTRRNNIQAFLSLSRWKIYILSGNVWMWRKKKRINVMEICGIINSYKKFTQFDISFASESPKSTIPLWISRRFAKYFKWSIEQQFDEKFTFHVKRVPRTTYKKKL